MSGGIFKDRSGYWRDGWVVTAMVGGIILAVALIVGVVAVIGTRVQKHYDRAACHSFQQATGRETHFVAYTYWSWDCLTPGADGKLISTSALRDLTQP